MAWPQKNKSRGLQSGDLVGHRMSVLLEINLFPKWALRNSKFMLEVWQVAPPCIIHMTLLFLIARSTWSSNKSL